MPTLTSFLFSHLRGSSIVMHPLPILIIWCIAISLCPLKFSFKPPSRLHRRLSRRTAAPPLSFPSLLCHRFFSLLRKSFPSIKIRDCLWHPVVRKGPPANVVNPLVTSHEPTSQPANTHQPAANRPTRQTAPNRQVPAIVL